MTDTPTLLALAVLCVLVGVMSIVAMLALWAWRRLRRWKDGDK